MPKVSVIIPVYGVEKYIERCARSLFEQTLDDMEYIFVDDCSPDRSMEILDRIIDEYRPRFAGEGKVVRTERMPTNSGLPAVRRHGIQLATGDYIIHCDSDDWVDVTMYEKMYNMAVEEDADIVVSDFYVAYVDGRIALKQQYFQSSDPMDVLVQLLFQQLHGSCWNKLVKRACYTRNEIEYPTRNMNEDLALTTQLVYYSKKIVKVSQPLYYYFQNSQSITNGAVDLIKRLDRFYQCVDNRNIIFRFLERKHLTEKYADAILQLKFSARSWLEPYLLKKEIYRLWCETYPEVDDAIMYNPYAPFRIKLRFCLCKLRLYPIYYRIRFGLYD